MYGIENRKSVGRTEEGEEGVKNQPGRTGDTGTGNGTGRDGGA